MQLLLVAISHRTAPVELRERVDFQARGIADALRALAQRGSAREAVVVSTCNRAELYVACDEAATTRQDLVRFVSDFNGVAAGELAPHVYDVADLEVARHLFRVAAGLDSLVMGEPQILGQVKDAHSMASDAHTSGPVLNRLFHSSFAVGKRVRTETGLGSGAVSVSYAAVALARKIFGDLGGRSVAVIGAGEMGKLTALHMKSQAVKHVTIVSRTMAHAARTAEAIGGASAAPWEELDSVLAASDIVITATGAAAPILTRARVEAVMRPRRNRPLFIIDIAMPRDVEAAVGLIENVYLYNIDDLQQVVSDTQAQRAGAVEAARKIVDEQLEDFVTWHRTRELGPLIDQLYKRYHQVAQDEVSRTVNKFCQISEQEREHLEELARRIVNKLLHDPIQTLKQSDSLHGQVGQYLHAMERLFKLAEPPEDEDRGEP